MSLTITNNDPYTNTTGATPNGDDDTIGATPNGDDTNADTVGATPNGGDDGIGATPNGGIPTEAPVIDPNANNDGTTNSPVNRANWIKA